MTGLGFGGFGASAEICCSVFGRPVSLAAGKPLSGCIVSSTVTVPFVCTVPLSRTRGARAPNKQ